MNRPGRSRPGGPGLALVCAAWACSSGGAVAPAGPEGGADPGRDGADRTAPEAPADGPPGTESPARWAAVLPATGQESLRYAVVWSWEGATWDEQRRRYVIVTPDGRVVTFAKLAIALSTIGITACDDPDGGAVGGAALGRFLPRILGGLRRLNPLAPSLAHAGHASPPAPTFVVDKVIEVAIGAGPIVLGDRPTAPLRYCQLYQQFEAVDEDPAAPLFRQSLHAVGSIQASASAPAHDFDLETALPAGAFLPLEVALPADAHALDVVLERRPARAVAQVDWGRTGPDLPFDLLRALARTSRAVVRSRR